MGSVALWDMACRSRRVVLELISTKIHPVSTPLLAPRPRPRPIHRHIVRLFFLSRYYLNYFELTCLLILDKSPANLSSNSMKILIADMN